MKMSQKYFSFIHKYVKYYNIAWDSITRTKLHKMKKQNHPVCIIYNKDKFDIQNC